MNTILPAPVRHLYPFTLRQLPLAAGNLSYVDEGEGEAVLMLHGNPTWSFFYRNLIQGLSRRYRCIAPDHLGMGLSSKPQTGFGYRLAEHIENLVRLVEALQLKKYHLIVHDWGGPIGMGLASRFPRQVGKIVVMNTAAFRSRRIPLRIALCRTPLLGACFVRGLNGFAGPATWMATAKGLSREVKAGYLYPYRDWRSRIATHRFAMDIPMKPGHPSYVTLVEIEQGLHRFQDKPILLLWGMRDFCFNESFLRTWQARFPGAACHELPQAGHYLLEDAPVQTLEAIKRFLGDP